MIEQAVNDLFGSSSATFSDCMRYRYQLWRRWGQESSCVFVCLNPSTADALVDDPTVRRCVDYARRWGHGSFCMLNLFAFRATIPADMKAQLDPIGPDNDHQILDVIAGAGMVVAGWGRDGRFRGRDAQVIAAVEMVRPLYFLRRNDDGTPAHPLYLPKSLTPTAWQPATVQHVP